MEKKWDGHFILLVCLVFRLAGEQHYIINIFDMTIHDLKPLKRLKDSRKNMWLMILASFLFMYTDTWKPFMILFGEWETIETKVFDDGN